MKLTTVLVPVFLSLCMNILLHAILNVDGSSLSKLQAWLHAQRFEAIEDILKEHETRIDIIQIRTKEHEILLEEIRTELKEHTCPDFSFVIGFFGCACFFAFVLLHEYVTRLCRGYEERIEALEKQCRSQEKKESPSSQERRGAYIPAPIDFFRDKEDPMEKKEPLPTETPTISQEKSLPVEEPILSQEKKEAPPVEENVIMPSKEELPSFAEKSICPDPGLRAATNNLDRRLASVPPQRYPDCPALEKVDPHGRIFYSFAYYNTGTRLEEYRSALNCKGDMWIFHNDQFGFHYICKESAKVRPDSPYSIHHNIESPFSNETISRAAVIIPDDGFVLVTCFPYMGPRICAVRRENNELAIATTKTSVCTLKFDSCGKIIVNYDNMRLGEAAYISNVEKLRAGTTYYIGGLYDSGADCEIIFDCATRKGVAIIRYR